MTWLRIDDGFARHPKVVQLARSERWTWLEILCYCAHYKTNGHVLANVREVVPSAKTTLVEKLVSVRLLDKTEDGWKVHDWDDYNPSDPTAADRAKRYRDRNANRDATVTTNVTNGVTETVTRTAPRARASAPVPVPSPEVSSPSSVANGADDDESIKRELIRLATGDDQERRWLNLYRQEPGRVHACLLSAKKNATSNVGGYLDRILSNGSMPDDVDTRSPDERVYAACIAWVNSPAFDPETMDTDTVIEEIAQKERKLAGTLTFAQRTAVVHMADEKIEQHTAKGEAA